MHLTVTEVTLPNPPPRRPAMPHAEHTSLRSRSHARRYSPRTAASRALAHNSSAVSTLFFAVLTTTLFLLVSAAWTQADAQSPPQTTVAASRNTHTIPVPS